jgi:hypothetical protein
MTDPCTLKSKGTVMPKQHFEMLCPSNFSTVEKNGIKNIIE